MLEAIFAALLFDAAVIIIAMLICRGMGWRLPRRIGPVWIVEKLNRWINPDPKRFKAVFG